jgi:hypothetical protein
LKKRSKLAEKNQPAAPAGMIPTRTSPVNRRLPGSEKKPFDRAEPSGLR